MSIHRDDRGQISALGVMAAAAFACLLLLVVNTGYATSGKIGLQNAADASAVSGATWIARGLNIVSLNNVTETQLLAIMLIVPALDDALEAAEGTLEAEMVGCGFLLVGAAVCEGIIAAQLDIVYGYEIPVTAAVDADLGERGGPLWQAMEALHAISGVVDVSFAAIAEAESARVATQDGADVGILVPAGYRPTLPVREGRLRPDLCDPTLNGSPARNRRGYTPLYDYPLGVGPLDYYAQKIRPAFYPIENSFVTLYFNSFRDASYHRMCGGTAAPRPQEQRVSLAQCRLLGGGTAVWSVIVYETVPFTEPQPKLSITKDTDVRLSGPPRKGKPETVVRPCSWTPPGTEANGRYRTTEEIVEQIGVDADRKPVYQYRYRVVEYGFLAATRPASATPAPAPPASGSSSPGDPNPYLLGGSDDESADDVRRELRYLAVTYRAQHDTVAPTYFVSPLREHRMAYAQARVYNATAFDTFTQDWRVSLEPASMIEDGTLLGSLGARRMGPPRAADGVAASGFGKASALFDHLLQDVNLLRFFNNH